MDGHEARSIGAYCALFLLMSGDDLLNPGPTRNGKHPCITINMSETRKDQRPTVRQVDVLAMSPRCHKHHERRIQQTLTHRQKLVPLSIQLPTFSFSGERDD